MDLAGIIADATKGLPSLLGTLMVDVDIDVPTLVYSTSTAENVSTPNILTVQAVQADKQVFEDSSGIETILTTFIVFPTVQGAQSLITPLLSSIPTLATLTYNGVKYNISAVEGFVAGANDVAFRVGVSK